MNVSAQTPGSWRRILGTLTLAVLLEQLPWSGWALVVRPDFVLVGVLRLPRWSLMLTLVPISVAVSLAKGRRS